MGLAVGEGRDGILREGPDDESEYGEQDTEHDADHAAQIGAYGDLAHADGASEHDAHDADAREDRAGEGVVLLGRRRSAAGLGECRLEPARGVDHVGVFLELVQEGHLQAVVEPRLREGVNHPPHDCNDDNRERY